MRRRRFVRRRRVWIRVAALVPSALAVAAFPEAGAAGATSELHVDAVDSGDHPVVTLTVAPPQELAQADLPAEAFTLVENGRRVPVEVGRMTEAEITKDGLEIVLVIDTSGSMKGAAMESAKRAAGAFLTQMPAGTKVGVVGFGDTPYVSTSLGDAGAAHDAVRGLQPAGETALYDALLVGLTEFSTDASTRHAMVVLSDGGDTASAASLEAASAALDEARIEFAAVELVTPEYDGSALASLAAAAGGLVLSADDPARLESLYGNVAATLLNRYAVTYTTRSGGATEVALAVEWDGVVATVQRPVNLPALGAPVSVAAPDATVHGQPGWLGSSGALRVGLGISFAALVFVLAWVLLKEREVKVRLSDRRGRSVVRLDAVSAWAARASGMAQRRLERSGHDPALYSALERAGMAFRPGEFVVLAALAAFVAFAVGLLLLGPAAGLVLAIMTAAGFAAVLRRKGAKRCGAFAEQLADTLQLLTGSLRAGHSILQAMDTVAHDAPSPTQEEFRRLVVETRLGRDLPDALRAMQLRIGNQDFEWFVQALQIHREVGGDLAQILDTVAGTIRERARLRRHVRTLSAEGRLSGIILFVLPIVVALLVSVMTPGYLVELFHGPGLIMLGGAAVFMTGGFFWLRKMVRIDF